MTDKKDLDYSLAGARGLTYEHELLSAVIAQNHELKVALVEIRDRCAADARAIARRVLGE